MKKPVTGKINLCTLAGDRKNIHFDSITTVVTLLKRKYEIHTKRSKVHTTMVHTIGMFCKHTNNGMLCIPLHGMF